jgi:hypothetical protein
VKHVDFASLDDRVEEIETAIANLTPSEYRCLVDWFRGREQSRWEEQIDADPVAGTRLPFQ